MRGCRLGVTQPQGLGLRTLDPPVEHRALGTGHQPALSIGIGDDHREELRLPCGAYLPDAIAAAAAAEPAHAKGVAPGDPQGLTVGASVVIKPDVDGGEQPVEGTIWAANAEEVSVLRHDPDCGDICVHFPRAGYRIDLA